MESPIEMFSKLRDLGVILNDNATFGDHIEHVCKKVRQKMGWILRTYQLLQPAVFAKPGTADGEHRKTVEGLHC
jgi:hypothetical protein